MAVEIQKRDADEEMKVSQMKTECKFNVPTAEGGANPLPRGLSGPHLHRDPSSFHALRGNPPRPAPTPPAASLYFIYRVCPALLCATTLEWRANSRRVSIVCKYMFFHSVTMQPIRFLWEGKGGSYSQGSVLVQTKQDYYCEGLFSAPKRATGHSFPLHLSVLGSV